MCDANHATLLLRYRRNGIRHIEECHEFEVARSRRDKKKENKKKSVSIYDDDDDADQEHCDHFCPGLNSILWSLL